MRCILICFINTHLSIITYNCIDVSRHSSERIRRHLTISYGKCCFTFRTNHLSTRFFVRITFDNRGSIVYVCLKCGIYVCLKCGIYVCMNVLFTHTHIYIYFEAVQMACRANK